MANPLLASAFSLLALAFGSQMPVATAATETPVAEAAAQEDPSGKLTWRIRLLAVDSLAQRAVVAHPGTPSRVVAVGDGIHAQGSPEPPRARGVVTKVWADRIVVALEPTDAGGPAEAWIHLLEPGAELSFVQVLAPEPAFPDLRIQIPATPPLDVEALPDGAVLRTVEPPAVSPP